MLNTNASRVIDGAECEVDYGKDWPLVPDGEYQAVFIGHETARYGRSSRAYLHFRIVDPGAQHGKELYRAYPVAALKGRPQKGGAFRVTKHQWLFKLLCKATDAKARPDRLSLNALKNRVWVISTRTVRKDYRQNEHPVFCQYSVVDEVKHAVTG
jgi:hypothetical protein